ncbi:MAG TPA: STAS domain-containing protein [Acidimicrobiia bacterium]|jgi:anti-sigma B factor antagonist
MAVRERVEGASPFRCDVLYVEDHAVVMTRGAVDLNTAPAMHRQMSATLALPITGITVDLAYVSFLDSSGVNVLVQTRADATQRDIAFRLESVPRNVRLVLDALGLLDLFAVRHETPADDVASA